MSCWKRGESPSVPTSDSPPASTSPLHFDEEDPLSQPQGNIATFSLEPIVEESLTSPTSDSEDVPLDGKSVKGNVTALPQNLQSTTSSNPPTSDDACPYVLICGKRFNIPEAYPKGAEGQLMKD